MLSFTIRYAQNQGQSARSNRFDPHRPSGYKRRAHECDRVECACQTFIGALIFMLPMAEALLRRTARNHLSRCGDGDAFPS